MAGFVNDIMVAENVDFRNVKPAVGQMTADGDLLIGSTAAPNIKKGVLTSPDNSITIGYSDPNITLVATDLHVAEWIVNPVPGSGGNQTTIAAALTAASSGDTIFIMPGIYTENLTLKAGVNLVAFNGDADTPNVTIIGNSTFTNAGTVSISGIRLQTNGAALLTVSGSADSIVNLKNCYLNCTNNTGISLSSSSASALINLYDCNGNLGTTGISYFSQSSNGSMNFFGGIYSNTGLSVTANVATGNGNISFYYVQFQSILSSTTNSTNFIVCNSYINIRITSNTSLFNGTGISMSGSSGNIYATNSFIGGGSSSAISIGAGTVGNIYNCTIHSVNANAITGAGSILYSGLSFIGSSTINVTTKTISGTLQGSKNTAPTAGMLGEYISANLGNGSAMSLSSGIAKTLTSINLTAGIWDISCIGTFTLTGSTSPASQSVSISPTTNVMGSVPGEDSAYINFFNAVLGFSPSLSVPSYRVSLNSSATYYLVVSSTFSGSTTTAYGSIRATRVG